MDYSFSNILGAPYRGGRLVLSDKQLLSPIGDRITQVDLLSGKSRTLSLESSTKLQIIVISPGRDTLLAIAEDGKALLFNLVRNKTVHHFSFKHRVQCAKYSSDGKLLAVATGRLLQIWNMSFEGKSFAPLQLLRTFGGATSDVLCFDWSENGSEIVEGSEDSVARVFLLSKEFSGDTRYKPSCLTSHRDSVLGAYFCKGNEHICTVASDAVAFFWVRTKSNSQGSTGKAIQSSWTLHTKHVLHKTGSKVSCSDFCREKQLLVAGFTNGVFELLRVPSQNSEEFESLSTLSISREAISSTCFGNNGEWIALGCEKLGQLLVWEWRSESYIFRQQGHSYDIASCAFSPGGDMIATGADDSRVKVWSAVTGNCIVTFMDHTMPVTAVGFLPGSRAIATASLDGTVRAFDLVRYRNFRVFTSPRPVQFTSLAVHPSGEVICAGTADDFQIYVWSVKSARLLEILAGHEGPVSGMQFGPAHSLLASTSWDKTLRIWDVFEGKGRTEPMAHSHDVLALAYRPDGKQIATSTLGGQIYLWKPMDGLLEGTIAGRRDIEGIHPTGSAGPISSRLVSKHFVSLCYSADGTLLLAAGNGKHTCMYDVAERVLLRRFKVIGSVTPYEMSSGAQMAELGRNGIDKMHNDHSGGNSSGEMQIDLPGASGTGQVGGWRSKQAPARIRCVQLSPSGSMWIAGCSEGLVMYTSGQDMLFDPTDLEESITPEAVLQSLGQGKYATALLIALRLNNQQLVEEIILAVPPDAISGVFVDFPLHKAGKLMEALSNILKHTPHIEHVLRWTRACCSRHALLLCEQSGQLGIRPQLRALQRQIQSLYQDLRESTESNLYTMQYISSNSVASQ